MKTIYEKLTYKRTVEILHPIIKTAYNLKNVKKLINRFPIKSGMKTRWVNDPIPELKTALKDWNEEVTEVYEKALDREGLTLFSQAYLPGKSIKTNAKIHQHSTKIIKFDFSGFYDSVSFDYIKDDIRHLTDGSDHELELIKRLIIDPKTGGVTQGLPMSGALAGLALIPFWKELKQTLDKNIMFTQYSDDLTFSLNQSKETPRFNIEYLSLKINQALKNSNRDFDLNEEKTTVQERQFRKITGVRINHNNQLSCSRKDYRLLRTVAHVLSKESETEPVLKQFGFKSKESFTGKISYMRSIDETGKIDKLIDKYANVFLQHNLFKSWIVEKLSVFA